MDNYDKVAEWLDGADAVLITASNGLSIAEGYNIFADDGNFRKYFGEYREKYGVDCLIRGVFAPMSPKDRAGYMDAVHRYLIDDYRGSDVMKDLLKIIGSRPYFVVTSNADTHFQMNGFDGDRIFEVEGNFDGLAEGSPEWAAQQERFQRFVSDNAHRNAVLLELGIGNGNRLIKAPTMDIAARYSKWRYVTMNMPGEIYVPDALRERSAALEGDIAEGFRTLLSRRGGI